jgi:hypothetical protein
MLSLMVALVCNAPRFRIETVPPQYTIRSSFSWLRHVFGGGGYAGPKLRGAQATVGD